MEAAADFPGPAYVDGALARVENEAGFLALAAGGFGERLDVEIFEPGAQGMLDLGQTHAPAEEDAAVHMDFYTHAVTPIRAVSAGLQGYALLIA
jgi:hypothetical protein